MKYLNVTYHMRNGCETAETCITLPMEPETADDILKDQCDSPHVTPESAVGRILSALADLQGYDSAAFCCAEERKICLWNNSQPPPANHKNKGCREGGTELGRYFYTFGSDPAFPYQHGWLEVRAASWDEAHRKFREKYPDRHGGTLNCAFFYDEKQWAAISPETDWRGRKCHEVIE